MMARQLRVCSAKPLQAGGAFRPPRNGSAICLVAKETPVACENEQKRRAAYPLRRRLHALARQQKGGGRIAEKKKDERHEEEGAEDNCQRSIRRTEAQAQGQTQAVGRPQTVRHDPGYYLGLVVAGGLWGGPVLSAILAFIAKRGGIDASDYWP